MIFVKKSRRHFLQGVGGSLMALPLLPSLLSSKAYAQSLMNQQFLVIIGTDHGGTGVSNDWFPAPFIANPTSNIFTTSTLLPAGGQNGYAHSIRSAPLMNLRSTGAGHDGGNVDNGQQRVSFIIGSFLNPYINKMNLLVGIDGAMTNWGHSQSLTGGAVSIFPDAPGWPTLDHFLANSPKFYQDRTQISIPVLNRSHIGYSWTSNGAKYPETSNTVQGIYNELFNKYQNTGNTQILANKARRSFLIDRVLEDFNRLVSGSSEYARRISAVDKQRLSQHAELMFEVEQKHEMVINSCSDVGLPAGANGSLDSSNYGTLTDYSRTWDYTTTLMAAAFSCGATRLANFSSSSDFFVNTDNYHEQIAHQCTSSRAAQLTHNQNLRWQTEQMFAASVRKLDAIDAGNGQSLLDNGLVLYLHEAGPVTHDNNSIGCLMAGSCNGFFRTGQFVDYRNLQNLGLPNSSEDSFYRAGVPLQRLSANVLQAFGHVPADYRRNGRPGYGSDQTPPGARNGHFAYPTDMMNSLDNKLPIITS